MDLTVCAYILLHLYGNIYVCAIYVLNKGHPYATKIYGYVKFYKTLRILHGPGRMYNSVLTVCKNVKRL